MANPVDCSERQLLTDENFAASARSSCFSITAFERKKKLCIEEGNFGIIIFFFKLVFFPREFYATDSKVLFKKARRGGHPKVIKSRSEATSFIKETKVVAAVVVLPPARAKVYCREYCVYASRLKSTQSHTHNNNQNAYITCAVLFSQKEFPVFFL